MRRMTVSAGERCAQAAAPVRRAVARLTSGRRRLVAEIVGDAHEGVEGAHGPPLRRRQQQEGGIEVARLAGGRRPHNIDRSEPARHSWAIRPVHSRIGCRPVASPKTPPSKAAFSHLLQHRPRSPDVVTLAPRFCRRMPRPPRANSSMSACTSAGITPPAAARREQLPGPLHLEPHQLGERRREAPRFQIGVAIAETPAILRRQINSANVEIAGHVLPEIRQLQSPCRSRPTARRCDSS